MSATATFTAADGTTTTRRYAHGWTAGNAARKALTTGHAIKVLYIDHARSLHTEITLADGKIVGRRWTDYTTAAK